MQQMLSAADPASQRAKLIKLENQASAEGFWDRQDEAAAVSQEMSDINEVLRLTSKMQSQLDDVQTAIELIDLEVCLLAVNPVCFAHFTLANSNLELQY